MERAGHRFAECREARDLSDIELQRDGLAVLGLDRRDDGLRFGLCGAIRDDAVDVAVGDTAGVIAWLLSPEMRWITGQRIEATGGYRL